MEAAKPLITGVMVLLFIMLFIIIYRWINRKVKEIQKNQKEAEKIIKIMGLKE